MNRETEKLKLNEGCINVHESAIRYFKKIVVGDGVCHCPKPIKSTLFEIVKNDLKTIQPVCSYCHGVIKNAK